MQKITISEATEILKTHGRRYISMINYLHLCEVLDLTEDGGAIFASILSDDGKVWATIAADTEADMLKFRSKYATASRFAAIEAWMHPLLTRDRTPLWAEFCYTYHLPDAVAFPANEPLPIIPNELTPVIASHWTYQDDWALAFIQKQLERGISSVKYLVDQPVAWAAMQDDGALGFMFVLPEYRKHGYAREVTIDLIAKVRAAGYIPFLHIVHTNTASMALAQSMGFHFLKEIVWMEIQ